MYVCFACIGDHAADDDDDDDDDACRGVSLAREVCEVEMGEDVAHGKSRGRAGKACVCVSVCVCVTVCECVTVQVCVIVWVCVTV